MLVLGIETSCDETAAAVVEDGTHLRSNIVASQSEHIKFGGVVPEIAARAHIRLMLPVIEEALQTAEITLDDVDGIAVTKGPGLVGSLLVGISVAKTLSLARQKPLLGIHHLEGHIFANFLAEPTLKTPFICLLVSGGHSELILVRAPGDYELLGCTRDDAAGEAFDKVAKMLNLSYPGGPAIQKAATGGSPTFVDFPIARVKQGPYDFSFSGLKTAVQTYLQEHDETWIQQHMPDLTASFQEAVITALITKTVQAALDKGVSTIVLAGGVASNQRLRQRMSEIASREQIAVHYPPLSLCTDNAAMIAAAGDFYFKQGHTSDLTLNAYPTLKLG